MKTTTLYRITLCAGIAMFASLAMLVFKDYYLWIGLACVAIIGYVAYMPARNILHSDIAFATEGTIPCVAFVSLAFAGDIEADSVPLILFWASITVGLAAALAAAVRDKKPSVDASLIDRRQAFLLRMESVLWVVYLCAGYWLFMESMGKVKMIVFGVLMVVLGGIICSTTTGKARMAKYYRANTLPVFLIVLFALDLRFPLTDLAELSLDVILSIVMLSMLYRKWTLNHR